MRTLPWWLPALFFVGVIGLVSALGLWLAPTALAEPPALAQPGWSIIRPPNDVEALVIQDGWLWAGGKDGVVAIDRRSGAVVKTLACDPPLTYVQALLLDPNKTLWIGSATGLNRYDGKNCQAASEGLPDSRVNALYQDRAGRLWVGTWGGAAVREANTWRVMTAARDGLASDMVNVIFEDRDGALWFGSYVAPAGGVSVCKAGSCRVFSTANGLPHNNVTALIQAQDGTVWAGTGLLDRGGAAQFELAASGWRIRRVLTRTDGLAGEKVRSIFQERSGILWFGSEYDGLARLSGQDWQVFKEGLSDPEIKAILQDADGDLWLGTRDGITHIQGN